MERVNWARCGVALVVAYAQSAWALESAPATPELGILALGLFIGGILGWGLVKANGSLKAGLTVLGAALGTGPVLFMGQVGNARWSYPLGLIFGLLILYAYRARGEWLDGSRTRSNRLVALTELVFIIGTTIGVAVYSAL